MPATQMISWVKPASLGDVGTMGKTGSLASPLITAGSCCASLPFECCQPWFGDDGGPALKSEGCLWMGATCLRRAIAGSRVRGYNRNDLSETQVRSCSSVHITEASGQIDANQNCSLTSNSRRYRGIIAICPKLNFAHGRAAGSLRSSGGRTGVLLGLYGAEEKGGGNEVIFYGGCS